MTKLQDILYTANVTSQGGRAGTSQSDDGRLQLQLSTPKGLGGDDGAGTNPEQLFAAGYSACFIGAMKHVAAAKQLSLSEALEVSAAVSIGPIEVGFGIAVELAVHIPGMAQADAEELVATAHQVCPYSNATRGNVEVTLSVTVS